MCYKMSFGSRREALTYAKTVKHGRHGVSARGKRLRPYECPECGGWHLTSSTKKSKKEKRRMWKKVNQQLLKD